MRDTERLCALIQGSRHAVFLGGAGVSTASGIPDFRGSGGLYTAGEDPARLLHRDCLLWYPEDFFRYYRSYMLYPDAEPNGAHRALARLEEGGFLSAVLTQNIDGLHQAAGSRNVIELHGSVHRNRCTSCGRAYTLDDILEKEGVPLCDLCGGIVRPDVVLYGEGLGEGYFAALDEVEAADLLIVGGTSLTVYPVASFAEEFTGGSMVIINRTPTPFDELAELVIREPIDAVLAALAELCGV